MTFEELKNILECANALTQWDNYTEYSPGFTVTYQSKLYQAIQSNVNVIPNSVGAAGVWKEIQENFE